MNQRWLHAGWIVLLLWTTPAISMGQTLPATNPIEKTDASESTPIRRAAAPSARSTVPRAAADSGFGLWRVLGAMTVVVATIFGARWLGQRMLGLPRAAMGGSAIRVLARATVSPRQQLMLVHVGRRIVLVANSGAQMNSLCEISEPDEVAAIVGQASERKSPSAAGSFSSIFNRADSEFASPELDPPATDEPAVAETRQELGSLLEKVKAIKGMARRPTRGEGNQ